MDGLQAPVRTTYTSAFVYSRAMTRTPLTATDEVQVGIVELRSQLGYHIDLAFHRDVVTRVSRGRRPMAVLISHARYEWLTARRRAHDSLAGVVSGEASIR